MVHPVAYGIPSWGLTEYTAKFDYRCRNCGDTIPAGTRYLRAVERLGPRKFKDPLRNVHFHKDCLQKWYVPDTEHLLPYLAATRKSEPGSPPLPALLVVKVASEELGTLLWQLPASLVADIVDTPCMETLDEVPGELREALTIVLTAFLEAKGSPKRSVQLSNLLHELKQIRR